jgi:tetratricopeptide (TPR) repeat protein
MRLHDRHQRVLALSQLGRCGARARGRPAARGHFEQALRESRDIGFAPYIAHALGHLGRINAAEGNHGDALRRQQEALQVCVDSGNRLGAIRALIHGGHAHRALGQVAQAYDSWREAAESALDAGAFRHANQAIEAMSEIAGDYRLPAGPESSHSQSPPSADRLRALLGALPDAVS